MKSGKEQELNIKITSDKSARYIIDGQEFIDEITLKKIVDFEDTIEIYSNTVFLYSKCYIKYTNLPVVNISNNVNDVNLEYIYGNVNIIDPNYEENESKYLLNVDVKIRTRGTSSSYEDKKSYRLTLVENNNKKDLALLGMRTDSDWILDSLYADDAYVRNGMGYDLWNLMNQDIDHEYAVILRWQFVEVFMDDEYIGLYVLKEPIDEDTLGLSETSNSDSGILLKGIDHAMADFSEENIKNIKEEVYYGFEIKYPRDLKDNSKYWYKILTKMKDYYTGNITDQVIEDNFYMDNFVNYRLLLIALEAVDNYEPKNTYFSLKDMSESTKLLLTPWDMDLTFGLEWDDIEGPKKSYENVHFFENKYKQYDIIDYTNSQNYLKALKSRWNFLRKEVFNDIVINNLIDGYENKLVLSGAANRNYVEWGKDTDINTELDEIRQWCKKRFEVVDKYINNL